MEGGFLHYEIVGPRSTLDAWLGVLQDGGLCHLADAMRGLEGHEAIARPAPTMEELQAHLIRDEALRQLRSVARVLPPGKGGRAAQARPAWQLGVGGRDAETLSALHAEASGIAARVRESLGAVREAEAQHRQARGWAQVLALFEKQGASTVGPGIAYLWSHRRRWSARRVARAARAAGMQVSTQRDRQGRLLMLHDAAEASLAAPDSPASQAHGLGGERLHPLEGAASGTSLAEARAVTQRRVGEAAASEAAARGALRQVVAEVGERGRDLLDGLLDAHARFDARTHLAGTAHMTAARVYVRREDAAELRDALQRLDADGIVLRRLPPQEDEPALARAVATAPLQALQGLRARRLGDMPMAAMLALVAPLAVGLVWADVVGGMLLMVVGGLLGLGARRGSPRRDMAILAQLGGVLAVLAGGLAGRAAGSAGVAWFGDAWGLSPGTSLLGLVDNAVAAPFVGVLLVVGCAAFAVSLWGGFVTLRSWSADRIARARHMLIVTLHFAVVAGLAACALPEGHALRWFGWLAPIGLGVILVLAGPRHALVGLGLDLAGVARIVAVAGAGLLVVDQAFLAWADGGWLSVVAGTIALVVASLAMVADPAHLAMGMPYDVALGGRRFARAFTPFERRGRLADDSAMEGSV